MSEPLAVRPVMSEPFHKRHRRWLTGWSIAAVFFVFVGIANIGAGDTEGTSSNDQTTTADAGTTADDNYEQTWPKSYSSTTCREWNGEVSADQQWAAAADNADRCAEQGRRRSGSTAGLAGGRVHGRHYHGMRGARHDAR